MADYIYIRLLYIDLQFTLCATLHRIGEFTDSICIQTWRNTETKAGSCTASRWVEPSRYCCTGRIQRSGMVQSLWHQCVRCVSD